MSHCRLVHHRLLYELENFEVKSIEIDSEVLKGNYLGDPHLRRHPVLVPKQNSTPTRPHPVIFHLSGLGSNGPKAFNDNVLDLNPVQLVDRGVSEGRWPPAVHVYVDGLTSLGGSQFINSPWTGRYEDHIVGELEPAVGKLLGEWVEGGVRLVFGGSSGGYGALHLSTQYPEKFPYAAATAPDGAFEVSLLPDLFASSDVIEEVGGVAAAVKAFKGGEFKKKRNYFKILNSLAMTLCYSEKSLELPFDPRLGEIDQEVWAGWLRRDPVHFLPNRANAFGRLKGLYMDVGTEDQFFLYFATRRLDKWIRNAQIGSNFKYSYEEFRGNHFDIGERRQKALDWFFEASREMG